MEENSTDSLVMVVGYHVSKRKETEIVLTLYFQFWKLFRKMLQLSKNDSEEKTALNGVILADISLMVSLFQQISRSFVSCIGEVWQIFLKQVIKLLGMLLTEHSH